MKTPKNRRSVKFAVGIGMIGRTFSRFIENSRGRIPVEEERCYLRIQVPFGCQLQSRLAPLVSGLDVSPFIDQQDRYFWI